MMNRKPLTLETVEPNLESSPSHMLGSETCMNPWNGKCSNTDVTLYIMHRGQRLPICRECWEVISSKDIEWMYD